MICAAANVSDLGYTPPGLGVTSFVFSPDHVGGPLVGSIPTVEYESRLTRIRFFQKVWNVRHRDRPSMGRLRDVSPLSAVSISGAAVSPSMGRMNQPAYRMLIAMLNLRLGVWLANPRLVRELEGDSPAFKPLVRPTYLLRELLGQNNLRRKFVYVSDGGHYENLGLVELLRRGCTTIYAIDASGDTPGTIRTLGQAVALARSELGVEFDDIDPAIFAVKDPNDPGIVIADHATLHYTFPAGGGDGTLVYIKKALVKDKATPGRPDLVPAGSPGVPVRLDRRSVLRRRTVRGLPRPGCVGNTARPGAQVMGPRRSAMPDPAAIRALPNWWVGDRPQHWLAGVFEGGGLKGVAYAGAFGRGRRPIGVVRRSRWCVRRSHRRGTHRRGRQPRRHRPVDERACGCVHAAHPLW